MEQKKTELKPTSFRITDETAEKFKLIAKEIGGNQQQTLSKLIESYEFQSGKEILTEKRADIEKFESFVTLITRMYMDSLEQNQNITETVKADFEASLKSKDKVITDLQAKCERVELAEQEAKEKAEKAERTLKEAADEVIHLKKELEKQTKEYEKQLQTLEEAKNGYVELCTSLNKQLAEVEPIKDQLKELNTLKDELNDLKTQLKEKDLEHKQKLLDMQEKMQQEKMQHFAEIEAYQKKYMELLEEPTKKKED